MQPGPMRRVWPLLVVVCVAGCALPLDKLGAFPCPADSHCPSGLACNPDGTCGPAQPGAPCFAAVSKTDTKAAVAATDCSAAGDGFTCNSFHYCGRACGSEKACPAGSVCGEGTCLNECTDGGCPTGFSCDRTYVGEQRVCVPPDAGVLFSACQGFNTLAQCETFRCPANTVSCGTGGCPTHTTCTNASRISCSACPYGYATSTCAGAACSGSTCPAGNWACQPIWVETCTGTSRNFVSGTCVCKDGRTFPRSCSDTFSCEERCRG